MHRVTWLIFAVSTFASPGAVAAPTTEEFMNVMTVCAGGSNIVMDSNMEERARLIQQEGIAQGKATQTIVTELANAIVTDEALHQRYIKCMIDLLSIKSSESIEEMDLYPVHPHMNAESLERLKANDGELIFVRRVHLDEWDSVNSAVWANCFEQEPQGEEHSIDNGYIVGVRLPIAEGFTREDYDEIERIPDEGKEEYINSRVRCIHHFIIEGDQNTSFPTSTGGTGMFNVMVNQKFRVSMGIGAGGVLTFYLRPVGG